MHPQLLTFLHVLPGQYLLGGSMVAIGAALAWCRGLLGLQVDYPELIGLAEGAEPGAGNLLYLPYMSGELQPINDGNARGVLFGLTLSTGRPQIVRAVLEGTAFAIAHNLAIVESTGIAVDEIRGVGRAHAIRRLVPDHRGRDRPSRERGARGERRPPGCGAAGRQGRGPDRRHRRGGAPGRPRRMRLRAGSRAA